MVQSAVCDSVSNKITDTNWSQSKKTTFENVQKKDEAKKESEKSKDNRYGAWGPVFKNKEHFGSLHHC
ncbi:hypothetical protein BDFB_001901 [Asbolus verrucosus]|uniref:Uncharacterized protein n=1 Tax=Asbolus verrucosus TaxID=1661398 RepID=A0A482W6A7_ASBVE|nr:hypothetical protein BDFB_001901 [Asbolus verrucosus]